MAEKDEKKVEDGPTDGSPKAEEKPKASDVPASEPSPSSPAPATPVVAATPVSEDRTVKVGEYELPAGYDPSKDPRVIAQMDKMETSVQSAAESKRSLDALQGEHDKTNTELQKLKRKAMTADELKEDELKQLRADKAADQEKIRNLEQLQVRTKILLEMNLDPRLHQFVTGGSEEEIRASVTALQATVEERATAQADKVIQEKEAEADTVRNQPTATTTVPARKTEQIEWTPERIAALTPAEYKVHKASILLWQRNRKVPATK